MAPVYDNISAAAHQDDRHYANIHFSPYRDNVLYSSTRLTLPYRQTNEEEEEEEDDDDVEYTTVNVDSVRSASR